MHPSGSGALLLVEDEERLRGLIAQFLRGEGFHVVEADDGPPGVARFADSGPFDLVLVDLNLPTYSGVEVCRRIKGHDPAQRLMVCTRGDPPSKRGRPPRLGSRALPG